MASIDAVINDLQRRFSKALSTRDLKDLGKLAIAQIRRRTRGGRGVRNTGGNERQFAPLSEQYIAFRQRVGVDRTSSPSTSNLTFSGAMLRSLRVIEARSGTRGTSRLIVGPTGQSNIKKAGFVSVTRPFMNLSRRDITKVRDLMIKRIRANVRAR